MSFSSKLPLYFQQRILSLPEDITLPETFALKSSPQKLAIYNFLKHKSEPLTEFNAWVWFGAASGGSGNPTYNNKPVMRELYRLLVDEHLQDGCRLRRAFDSKSYDVNPFKVYPSSEKKKQQLLLAQLAKDSPEKLSELEKTSYSSLLTKAIIDVRASFSSDYINTKAKMNLVLKGVYPANIIMHALDKAKVQWVTTNIINPDIKEILDGKNENK